MINKKNYAERAIYPQFWRLKTCMPFSLLKLKWWAVLNISCSWKLHLWSQWWDGNRQATPCSVNLYLLNESYHIIINLSNLKRKVSLLWPHMFLIIYIYCIGYFNIGCPLNTPRRSKFCCLVAWMDLGDRTHGVFTHLELETLCKFYLKISQFSLWIW